MGWVDQTPLWTIGLAGVLGLIGAHELGYRAGQYVDRRGGHTEGKDYHVSSILSLVALMMAFTFGAAQTEFRQRQELMVAESNALGTAYLRIQTLPQPWRDLLSGQMVRYADERGAFHDASGDPDELSRNGARTAAQQQRIWEVVGRAVEANLTPTLNAPLMQSINDAFAIAASRRAAEDIRLPTAVLLMLVTSGFVTTVIVGFAAAADRRYPYVTSAVLIVQIMAFCLILGLDRPGPSTVGINQAPMERAIAAIRQSEAAKAAGGKTGG